MAQAVAGGLVMLTSDSLLIDLALEWVRDARA